MFKRGDAAKQIAQIGHDPPTLRSQHHVWQDKGKGKQ